LHHLGATVAGYSVGVPTTPSNFEILGLASHIEHHVGDIRDRDALGRVVDAFRPEIVFHLAAQALVRPSYIDPVTTFETNMMGMVNVLECIRTRPWVEAVVLITSDKAYRNDEWVWGYRETDPLCGRDPYSNSKSCAELVAYSYFHSFLQQGPTRVATTRAGNVIGGGDWAADRIVPDCIRSWSAGEVVSIRSPMATRPWQHVLEPLSGYLWLGAQLYASRPGVNGEAFNFGPDAAVDQTVGQLIEAMVARWPGVRWQVPDGFQHGGHEAKLLKLSCDKALALLQWKAVLRFDETVDMTVNWYREWRGGHVDMAAFTRGQIREYTARAAERSLRWAAT
jgi:CDP-glucose 4,6-dehydratase